jgi:HK97 family phage prohead protease
MKHELKFKDFKLEKFEIKKDSNQDERLIISGWAARFGNIDSYGDIIEPGAFTKTISERKGRIAFCYQHEIDEPIAKILVLEERAEGLWVEAEISASEDDIQTKIKEGILFEMSIGYRTINCTEEIINEKYITHLTEVKLYEISLVTIAANEMATIQNMKSEEKKNYIDDSFERLITLERNQSRKYDLMKLKNQVKALLDEEPVKATPTSEEPPKSIDLTKQDILNILRN